MVRFATQWLAAPENFTALSDLSDQWIAFVSGRRPSSGVGLYAKENNQIRPSSTVRLPKVMMAVRAAPLCSERRKREYSRQFGRHLRNPG